MHTTYHPAKIFTPEQANAMLPLVRAIVSDASQLAREVSERRQRISDLKTGRSASFPHDAYAEELSHVEQELDRQTDRLQDYSQELLQIGAELKDAAEGLVDFPAMIGGELAYLCWKLGEGEVQHWHALSEGFAARQLLPSEPRISKFDSPLNN